VLHLEMACPGFSPALMACEGQDTQVFECLYDGAYKVTMSLRCATGSCCCICRLSTARHGSCHNPHVSTQCSTHDAFTLHRLPPCYFCPCALCASVCPALPTTLPAVLLPSSDLAATRTVQPARQ